MRILLFFKRLFCKHDNRGLIDVVETPISLGGSVVIDRYYCEDCKHIFYEPHERPGDENKA